MKKSVLQNLYNIIRTYLTIMSSSVIKNIPELRTKEASQTFRLNKGRKCTITKETFRKAWTQAKPSYCHVFEQIWLGNVDAGLGAAIGGRIGDFSAAFDASGMETRGVSLVPCFSAYSRTKVVSLADPTTGLALADRAFVTDLRAVARDFVAAAKEAPPFYVFSNDDHRPLFQRFRIPPINTEVSFLYFMMRADEKIRTLLDGKLLVFCIGGVNRSAASIVAYLVLSKNFVVDDAIELVRAAALKGRNVRVLTNESFVGGLRTLPGKNKAAVEKAFYDQYDTVIRLACETFGFLMTIPEGVDVEEKREVACLWPETTTTTCLWCGTVLSHDDGSSNYCSPICQLFAEKDKF